MSAARNQDATAGRLPTTIGYVVIIAAAFWLVGRFLKAKETERNDKLAVYGFERDLAYRAIYRSTIDPSVRQMVKDHCGSWSVMGLEDDDATFYKARSDDPMFRKAWDAVKRDGMSWVLKEGQIVLKSQADKVKS